MTFYSQHVHLLHLMHKGFKTKTAVQLFVLSLKSILQKTEVCVHVWCVLRRPCVYEVHLFPCILPHPILCALCIGETKSFVCFGRSSQWNIFNWWGAMRLVLKLKLFFSNGSPQTDAVHGVHKLMHKCKTWSCIWQMFWSIWFQGVKFTLNHVELQETQNIHYCS